MVPSALPLKIPDDTALVVPVTAPDITSFVTSLTSSASPSTSFVALSSIFTPDLIAAPIGAALAAVAHTIVPAPAVAVVKAIAPTPVAKFDINSEALSCLFSKSSI